jgi:2-methylcitrate dehydratase PrpD
MTRPITLELGNFIAGLHFDDIPPAAVDIVRGGFADTCGVLIGGAFESAPTLLRAVLQPGAGKSSLLFGLESVSAPEAAWINATAAHALDFDDTAVRSHPSAVLVPAIFAEAQELGASGEAMVTAYVAGYETWAELALRDPQQPVRKGWHPTGVFGAVAAAAACAVLRNLDAARSAQALALGASQSAGIVANFGTMSKPFHAGRAAHAGVMSARLAAAGFTAATDALEHPQGFLSAVSPEGRVDLESAVKAGIDWHILNNGLNVKKYPMCYCAHRHIDALLELMDAHGLRPAMIRHITVSVGRRNWLILRNHNPVTGLEAKFSIEFAMAAALVAGRISLVELNDAFVARPEIRALMAKVRADVHDAENPKSGHAPFDWVTVETLDGQIYRSRDIEFAKGAFEVPLSQSELKYKFLACLEAVDSPLDGDQLFQALYQIDSLPEAASLTPSRFMRGT